MSFVLSDIFIGNFPITQNFGARPDIYSARYGIRGHNGQDYGCKTMTPILSTADGVVSETGFDKAGYGNYVKVVHSGFLSLYGHLNDIAIKKGDHVVTGQLIAHSDNTGFSDAPHLHFGVALCDANGNKTEKANGYSGYRDPNAAPFTWNIKNPTAPVTPSHGLQAEPIKVDPTDFTNMVSEGSSGKVIVSALINKGLNEFLSVSGKAPINVTQRPADPTNGEKVVFYLDSLYRELQTLQHENRELKVQIETLKQNASKSPPLPQNATPEEIVASMPPEKRDLLLTNSFKSLLGNLGGFIFTKK